MSRPMLMASLIAAAIVPNGVEATPDDAIIDRAYRAVVKYRLVADPACVNFAVTRNVHPGVDEVDVRETHDRRCGGDPAIAPLVVVLRIDRRRDLIARMDVTTGKFRLLEKK